MGSLKSDINKLLITIFEGGIEGVPKNKLLRIFSKKELNDLWDFLNNNQKPYRLGSFIRDNEEYWHILPEGLKYLDQLKRDELLERQSQFNEKQLTINKKQIYFNKGLFLANTCLAIGIFTQLVLTILDNEINLPKSPVLSILMIFMVLIIIGLLTMFFSNKYY